MRILWLTNIPIGKTGELFFGKKSNGLWMDAALAGFEQNEEHRLFVATTAAVKETRSATHNGVTYYLLPDRPSYQYKSGKPSNLAAMTRLLEETAPDIIQLWGAEQQAAADLTHVNGGRIPTVVYIQGVIASLERYFTAGIPTRDILRNYTPSDLLLGSGIYQQMRRYRRQAVTERQVVSAAGNLIGENLWSCAYYRAISPDVRFHACPLPLNRCFADGHWDLQQVHPHSIMCNSSNYSIKGLHMLLRALALVKRSYPDVLLYLPGNHPAGRSGLRNRLLQSGYARYIRRLIRRLDLTEQVKFLPLLSAEQMARQMEQAHVFVVSSAIENHSSSLKEAMLLGVPSIGTYVGGVSEYLRHGENGFLYRFEEPEVLADLIDRIFRSPELAQRLSRNGRADMQALHVDKDLHRRTLEIYQTILEENECEDRYNR